MIFGGVDLFFEQADIQRIKKRNVMMLDLDKENARMYMIEDRVT